MAGSVAAVFLLLFAATRASVWDLPTVFSMDGAELVIAARGLGVDHPPGHPLYLILGHLFSRLPWESPDTGVILVSVVAGALAVALVFLAALECTGRRLAAVVAALALGLAQIFWLHSTIVEVYAVQSAALALTTWLAARAIRRRSAPALPPVMLALGLLATTNPLLAVLVVPVAAVAVVGSGVLRRDSPGRGRRAAVCAGALLAGLAPLLYIPWRLSVAGTYVNDLLVVSGYPLQSLTWYAWYLSGWEFVGEKVAAYGPAEYPRLAWQYVVSLGRNLSPVGALFAAGGAWTAARVALAFVRATAAVVRARRAGTRRADRVPARLALWADRLAGLDGTAALLAVLVGLGFVATVVPVVGYQVPDREVFYLPSFFFAALFAGLGASEVARRGSRAAAVVAVGALAIAVWGGAVAGPAVRAITRDTTRHGERLARFQQIPKDAVIIGYDDGLTSRYRYFGLVRGLRPDIAIETFARNAPRYQGHLSVSTSALTETELRAGLNLADRVQVLNGLMSRHADRPMFLILTDRIPPEFPNVRLRRSAFDPQLFAIEPKAGVTRSTEPLAATVAVTADPFPGTVRLTGWGVVGLDGMGSASFPTPLAVGPAAVNALVLRGELFELSFVVRRERAEGAEYFAAFSLLDAAGRVVELPESGFAASRQVQVMDAETPAGSFRRDAFDFRLPPDFPAGAFTLAVRLYVATGEVAGTYKGREVRRMRPVPPSVPMPGQPDYAVIGTVMVQ